MVGQSGAAILVVPISSAVCVVEQHDVVSVLVGIPKVPAEPTAPAANGDDFHRRAQVTTQLSGAVVTVDSAVIRRSTRVVKAKVSVGEPAGWTDDIAGLGCCCGCLRGSEASVVGGGRRTVAADRTRHIRLCSHAINGAASPA